MSMTASKDGESKKQAMSSKEIEALLKHGAYAMFTEDDNRSAEFISDDLDKIMARASSTIKYDDGTSGESKSTFSKAAFVAQERDSEVQLDDPDFWQKLGLKQAVQEAADDFSYSRARAPVQRMGMGCMDNLDNAPSKSKSKSKKGKRDDTPPSSDNAGSDSDASINSDASDDGELDDSLPDTERFNSATRDFILNSIQAHGVHSLSWIDSGFIDQLKAVNLGKVSTQISSIAKTAASSRMAASAAALAISPSASTTVEHVCILVMSYVALLVMAAGPDIAKAFVLELRPQVSQVLIQKNISFESAASIKEHADASPVVALLKVLASDADACLKTKFFKNELLPESAVEKLLLMERLYALHDFCKHALIVPSINTSVSDPELYKETMITPPSLQLQIETLLSTQPVPISTSLRKTTWWQTQHDAQLLMSVHQFGPQILANVASVNSFVGIETEKRGMPSPVVLQTRLTSLLTPFVQLLYQRHSLTFIAPVATIPSVSHQRKPEGERKPIMLTVLTKIACQKIERALASFLVPTDLEGWPMFGERAGLDPKRHPIDLVSKYVDAILNKAERLVSGERTTSSSSTSGPGLTNTESNENVDSLGPTVAKRILDRQKLMRDVNACLESTRFPELIAVMTVEPIDLKSKHHMPEWWQCGIDDERMMRTVHMIGLGGAPDQYCSPTVVVHPDLPTDRQREIRLLLLLDMFYKICRPSAVPSKRESSALLLKAFKIAIAASSVTGNSTDDDSNVVSAVPSISAAVKKATPAAAKVALQKKLANVSIAREMPPFPHLLPNGLCLLSLGSIVPLHAFHDVSYIHPLGYHATRLLPSIDDPSEMSNYHFEVCVRGSGDMREPSYSISRENSSRAPVTATAPQQAWKAVIAQVKSSSTAFDAVGLDVFGFDDVDVRCLIETLPGVKKCVKYKMMNDEKMKPKPKGLIQLVPKAATSSTRQSTLDGFAITTIKRKSDSIAPNDPCSKSAESNTPKKSKLNP